ncbi:MAG: energy transducer TonB [Thermodesulfobacteriota bacterium]|nr:energy transducer TonB [Thermodesulfobacteriota bacterium]
MIAQRQLLAFCCALVIHLLIILVPFLDENPLMPQLTGTKSIQINLASTSASNITPDMPNDEQEDIAEDIEPEDSPVPEKIIEPVQEKPKTVTPAAIQPLSKKQQKQTRTAAKKSPNRPKRIKRSQSSRAKKTPPKVTAAAKVTTQATPLYYKNPKPAYPTLARKRNWQGTVILSIMVLKNGAVGEVIIHKSSGHQMLDNSALRTVKYWRFVPGMKNGIPVSMVVQVPIHFKLD